MRVVDSEDPWIRFGYFVVYPLLGEAVRRVRTGEIMTDRQIEPADLASSAEGAAGWYIAVIWAPGAKWTRRCVLATLVDSLAASGAGSAQRPVFAHPDNHAGRRLMQRYRLGPVGGQADGAWGTP